MTGRSPQTPQQWREYAELLFQKGDLGASAAAFRRSFGPRGPQSASDFLSLARFAIFLSDYEDADEHIARALGLAPDNPDVRLTAARIALFQGDQDTARLQIEKALRVSPDHPMLLYQALELIRPLPADLLKHATSIAAGLATPTLRFGLARAWDRAGDHERAWQMAEAANAMQAARTPAWSLEAAEAKLRAAIDLFKRLDPANSASILQPIYFTGSPRCGGTLIETLISAHPQVDAAGERGALLRWLLPAVDLAERTSVQEADAALNAQRHALARADMQGLRSVGLSNDIIIDKTPANAEVAGLLARIHSRARFVDIDRDRRDSAISIFFHEFPEGYSYSSSLSATLEYLAFRRRAVTAWEQASLKIIRLRYEDFVNAPALEGDKLFVALGLSWSAEYLSTRARTAPVRTFSSVSVREPVNARKVGNWQRYSQYFEGVDG